MRAAFCARIGFWFWSTTFPFAFHMRDGPPPLFFSNTRAQRRRVALITDACIMLFNQSTTAKSSTFKPVSAVTRSAPSFGRYVRGRPFFRFFSNQLFFLVRRRVGGQLFFSQHTFHLQRAQTLTVHTFLHLLHFKRSFAMSTGSIRLARTCLLYTSPSPRD